MDDPVHPLVIEALKRMTPAEKLQRVCDLYHEEIRRRAADLDLEHPDWPQERCEWEARRSLRHAGT